MMRVVGIACAVFALACNGGKEDEHDHTGEGPVCSELAELCHEAGEAGDADAEACHDVAHEADEAACEAQLESCQAICEAVTAR